MSYNGFTEARKKANKKYNEKQERIYLMVAPEIKQHIVDQAKAEGKKITTYILDAVNYYKNNRK